MYSIALVTRGAGAFAYSYSGPPGLEPGQLVAVPFQHRLEIGFVVGPDPNPPERDLLPLVRVILQRWPRLGRLLLELCELSASAPDEVAGHLFFDSARASLRLSLAFDAEKCSPASLDTLGEYSGRITPARQKLLVRQHWEALAELNASGAVVLEATLAGDPGATRAPAVWRKHYFVSSQDAALLGLKSAEVTLPGNYLAGFDRVDLKTLGVAKVLHSAGIEIDVKSQGSAFQFAETAFPKEWELPSKFPQICSLRLRSARASWPTLRAEDGLLADLRHSLMAGQRVLVVCPQAWMVERLWPLLASIASHVSRFRAESGPGVASQILRLLDTGTHAVIGGPGAWKLAAYAAFDRAILIDPTHPQFAPERTPHLDPRLALLVSAAASGCASVDFIDLGLNAFGGDGAAIPLHLHDPYIPAKSSAHMSATAHSADVDPLPLELRRPDRRRLVYFNRLGSGRGLHCAECWASVPCPQCGSGAIHYSPARANYYCPECAYEERELRCPRCHLISMISVLPGLESVIRRPGDFILQGPQAIVPPATQWQSAIGTSQLLDPLPGFWPQQVIYVHSEGRVGLIADWPAAIDMALRLAALYENPELDSVNIVSERLVEQFGSSASSETIGTKYADELGLRELAGLPPNGTLYHLRAISARQAALTEGRRLLGEHLHEMPGTSLLRLGTSFRQGGTHRFGAWLINPQIGLRELQELRWLLHRAGVTLAIHPVRGPWVW